MKRYINDVLTKILTLTLLLLAGANLAWGQTTPDYSGTYFIANGNGYSSTNVANNYYLVPATNANYATGQPHLTTSKTGQVLNCCWQIVKAGEYYRIIHVADGKYLTANPAYSGTKGNDVGRLRVHLESMTEPDGNTLFEITEYSTGVYHIRHKDMSDNINSSTATYLDPAGGNVDGTNVTNKRSMSTSSGTVNVGGGIGYWSDEAAARWRFEEVPQNNTYTYNIVDRQGNIAIKYTVTNLPAAHALSSITDIPEAIRSPYLNGETVTFYTFSGDFDAENLTDENKISTTPVTNNANIYVTYTTNHLTEKFLHLTESSAYNMMVNSNYIYDNSGTLAYESAPLTTKNYMWQMIGGDPYAVQIKNADTGNYLHYNSPIDLSNSASNFILMACSTAGDDTYEQMDLLAATGDNNNYRIEQVCAYPIDFVVNYYLIDKAGKLIEGPINSSAEELSIPDEWKSPLVSKYHYFKTPGLSDGTYTPSDPVSNILDVGNGGNIYVTYDVGDDIDITGRNTYLIKFSDGVSFNQENGKDGIYDTQTKAVYPYNNGDFNLFVYGQEQWEAQLASGASTRTRWLWYLKSRHNGTDLTGDDADPYHVVIKSYQNHVVKDKDKNNNNADINYGPGCSYLQTYKPSDYSSVITNIAYENATYSEAYPAKMMVNGQTTSMVNGQPTEYMILGTSLQNMILKTFNEVEGERRVVNSFEQYWKNNPVVNGLEGNDPASNNATLTGMGWHRFTSWAYSAPWDSNTKALTEGAHWYQTISMGSGQFTLEEVSLTPQVILLDQHGWEIVRVPLSDTEKLRKYDSPMVEQYHWYPKADKVSGYHKYKVSNQEITVYDSDRKATDDRFIHNSITLSYTPYDFFETIKDEHGWVTQDDRVKSDFYVTYTVKPAYANAYQGAATEDAVVPSAYLVKQGGNYAKYSGSGSTIGAETTKPDRENTSGNMLWNLKPNFNIDHEMGYKYAGETGAQDGAKSQTATEQDYYDEGHNGFDPYNVQIQNKAYPLRYFTTNTSASALDGGLWMGTSSTTVTLQNLGTKHTATGYDQTTLNITNATFMVVSDANGNMRLMPRFDHGKVMQSFGTLAEQAAAASAGDLGTGTQTLYLESMVEAKEIHNSSEITDMNGNYLLAEDFKFANGFESLGTEQAPFTGIIDGQLNTLSGLSKPLVAYAKDATIRNVMLKNVTISQAGYVGAIACTANGTTRIYNCGILPNSAKHESDDRSSVKSTNSDCGSLVGYLDGYARVINCFSYAEVSAGSSGNAGGLVGNNTTATMQGNSEVNFNNNCKTMVVNCMFYGDIKAGGTKGPVYGGTAIANNAEHKVNNYNYFCQEEISFESSLNSISKYFNTWPVAKKYLTRFEVYRNILNSNRRLCTWWVNGAYNTAPTDADVESVGIAKWVLDLSIAPYPILKKWAKYPSVINPNPQKRVNPTTKAFVDRGDASKHWGKNMAPDTEGQILGTVNVTIKGGDYNSSGSDSRTINITAMDKDYNDYCYGKIQLPYYNEIFGNPDGTTWSEKYGNNYGDYVVTGWEITSTNGSDADGHSFSADWQDGYNFADRKCVSKDLYGTSGRVFAQGGYYYVPDGVTTITIKAHWGKAVYLCNKNYRLDMINNAGNEFYNAGALSFGGTSGILPLWPSGNTLKTSMDDAIDGLSVMATGSVYDQAIVLVGNYQYNSFHSGKILLNGNQYSSAAKPFTIMSADFDLDNEPDFCFQAGMNSGGRPNFQPIRFDFLMVPDITMAIRKDANYLGMRIICPQGHFEVTETSYMYITQFEYDWRTNTTYAKHEAPMILNGGEFFQLVSSELGDMDIDTDPSTLNSWTAASTSYFLLGGNLWMKAFTPGVHGNSRASTRHCAVNAIGGEISEFYLSGMFRTDFYNKTDNPHAYLDGGYFGLVAGAGMESVGGKDETNGGDVTFKINHSLIDEFYGGGINANRPVTGNISVTIDNSKVTKYCGGPKLGDMSNTKSITTNATGTTFDEYYGGGNGGTNLLRDRQYDAKAGVDAPTQANHSHWDGDAKFTAFTPFSYTSGKGYQAEYEFEMLPRTSGNSKVITRSYYYWASFSKTTVAPVTNIIKDCTFNGDFYGGGNLGAVDCPTSSTKAAISSTLSGHTVVHGSAFGAGYSASATSFKVHDKSTVVYPYRDNAGFIHDGSLDYEKISVEPLVYKEYTWIHDIPAAWGKSASTSSPTFEYNGINYCYTGTELTGLGTVTGNVSLIIEDTTEIDEDVYGGGDASAVAGNTTVILQGDASVTGNVFGGGNSGEVTGSASVTIREKPTSSNP